MTGRLAEAPRLDMCGLESVRGDRTLFSNLNGTLSAGEVLQIEGANGSGKTTLLRILCGLTRPTAGEVRWCGRDIRLSSTPYWADLVYVGHIPGLKDELTPIENLEMAGVLGGGDLPPEREQALQRVGLSPEYGEIPCHHLSAGQKRRVALARLLMTDARVWIVDEPFTALDRDGRRMVEELVSAHAARGGMAVLSTHHAVTLDNCIVHELSLS